MESKNQVIRTIRCKVMAKYISIYFDIFYEKLVYFEDFSLSLVHFGHQALEITVSQLQNGVSTSFLPPFVADLSAL